MGMNYKIEKDNEKTSLFLIDISLETYNMAYVDAVSGEILKEKEISKDEGYEILTEKANNGYSITMFL